MSGAERKLRVEVIHLRPGLEFRHRLELPAGSRVGDALAASGVLAAVPGLASTAFAVGIFSRPCGLDQRLNDGDRVEIYRPLAIDPKEARRRRAGLRRRGKPARG